MYNKYTVSLSRGTRFEPFFFDNNSNSYNNEMLYNEPLLVVCRQKDYDMKMYIYI